MGADDEDRAVMAEVVAGRQDALRVLWDRHGGATLGLARRVLGQDHQAEEIVQDVFTRLWTDPHRFHPDRGSLRSFLFRETHSRSIERLRSESARRGREERTVRLDAPLLVPDDPETNALDRARRASVRRALDALGEDERRAIELAYFGGQSYREVAEQLGAPEGTVKSRIRAGLRKLAEALGEAEGRRDEGSGRRPGASRSIPTTPPRSCSAPSSSAPWMRRSRPRSRR